MTIQVSISGNADKIVRDLKLVGSRVVPTATHRALKKAVQQTRTRALRKTAKDIGIAQKHIKRRFKWFAHFRKQVASVWVGLFGIPLDKISKAKTPIARLRFARRKGFKGVDFKGTPFQATMPSGHTSVFIRRADARHKLGRENNPDRPELGIIDVNALKVYFSDEAKRNLRHYGNSLAPKVFEQTFVKQLIFLLGRKRAR